MTGPIRTEDPAPSLRWIALILQDRWLVARTAALAVIVVAVAALVAPRTYSSNASFVAVGRSMTSNLTGLASQLGVALPNADASRSPEFYQDLALSSTILRPVAEDLYTYNDDGLKVSRTLVNVYDPDDRTKALQLDNTLRKLRQDVTPDVSQRTGVVSVTVRSKHPELAFQVVKNIVAEINQFNLTSRQTQAGAERVFSEHRLDVAQKDLRAAEDDLQAFLQANRDIHGSPRLTFENDRLTRAVATRQAVVSSLTQSYEQARLEEVRNLPVISPIEAPVLAVRPDSRHLEARLTVALVGGIAIGLFLVLCRGLLANQRDVDPATYKVTTAAWRDTLRDCIRPWRLFRRPPKP